MSKRIILPNTALRQREGTIIYLIGAVGEEISLQVQVSNPVQADLVCISGAMNFIGRIIQSSEEADVPEDQETERTAYIDGLRAAYAILSRFNQELSKANLNDINRIIA